MTEQMSVSVPLEDSGPRPMLRTGPTWEYCS